MPSIFPAAQLLIIIPRFCGFCTPSSAMSLKLFSFFISVAFWYVLEMISIATPWSCLAFLLMRLSLFLSWYVASMSLSFARESIFFIAPSVLFESAMWSLWISILLSCKTSITTFLPYKVIIFSKNAFFSKYACESFNLLSCKLSQFYFL